MSSSKTAQHDHVRGSSLLLSGRVFSILVNTGFQVMLVRYLSQSDFGVIAYGLTVAGLVQVVVSLGQERSVSRFLVFYEEQGRPDRVLGTLVLYVLSVGILGVLAFAVTVAIGGVFVSGLDNPDAAVVVSILVLMAPLDSLDMGLQATFAAFSKTKQIFFRKYILNPLIKLVLILAVVITEQPIEIVAVTFVLTSLIGVLAYGANVPALLRDREIWRRPVREHLELPTGDVLRFSVPLLSSPAVWTVFGLGTSTILAWYFDSVAVADFRAVWPAARLNLVVSSTFSVLFLPALARHVAQARDDDVQAAYWRTSAWVAALTMPAFLLTVPLARDTTVLLFGERYAGSASVLAIVSLGMYVDVVFGFNRQTLELYNRVWWVVSSDVVTVLVNLVLALALVPRFGPEGAAVANTVALILRNVVNQGLVVRFTPVSWFDRHYLPVYTSIALGAVVVGVVQLSFGPPVTVGYLVAVAVSLWSLRANRDRLALAQTFPEIQRIPIVRKIIT